MMMHISQLQGMNPLVAMNLQPPLIPPALLTGKSKQQEEPQQQGQPGTSKSDPMFSALLAQMQAASQKSPQPQPSPVDPQLQALSKLGIDPKALAQSGLDPKMLLQQFEPPAAQQQQQQQDNSLPKPPPFPDSNLLNLLKPPLPPGPPAGPPQGLPDAKTLLQMQQMGLLPNPPDPSFLLQLAKMGGGGGPKLPTPPAAGLLDPKIPFLPGFDPTKLAGGEPPKLPFLGQKPIFPPQPEQQQQHQQKRARTRITDDQLKVLRANFDISNSPTEESINVMAQQTGLPPKVIKHWFRNTLFKERQRNKDSPYNFNNPPSTMLNLEEYEKTGEPKVTMLNQKDQKSDEAADKTEAEAPVKLSDSVEPQPAAESSIAEKSKDIQDESKGASEGKADDMIASPRAPSPAQGSAAAAAVDLASSPSPLPIVPSTSACSSPVSRPIEPLSLSNILSGSPLSKPGAFPLPHGLGMPGFGPAGPLNPLPGVPGPLPPNLFNPLGNMLPGGDQIPRNPSPQPQGGGPHSQGKRANRTRFTDYQIKVLQEFFENNAYPKDDDLEYLSKLLNLSPRVIVVWFQNARQKARKIYENQPPLDPNDDGAGRFTRTPGLNYQCKKCLLVFQRYYELIRHQKQHCFKEEDAKRSAQAQKAAAQAAAQFSTQAISNMNPMTPHSEDSNSSLNHDKVGRSSSPINRKLIQ